MTTPPIEFMKFKDSDTKESAIQMFNYYQSLGYNFSRSISLVNSNLKRNIYVDTRGKKYYSDYNLDKYTDEELDALARKNIPQIKEVLPKQAWVQRSLFDTLDDSDK